MAKEIARPRRTSVNGTRSILGLTGKEPGFEYRIVNDEGDRVAQFQGMGYEIVSDANLRVGDRRVANPTAEGSPVQVSVGGGVSGYVMRIKSEWYAEDQAAKAAQIDEQEKALQARSESDYGKLQISK